MANAENVLSSIKKLLGPCEYDEHFDIDVLIHINTAVNILHQLGVFQNDIVVDKNTTWDEVIEGHSNAQMIKTYIYEKVRMIFDPPTGALKAAMEESIEELEWRINVQTDRIPCK